MSSLTYKDFFKIATKKDKFISRKQKFFAKMKYEKIGTDSYKQPFDMEDKKQAAFSITGTDKNSRNNKSQLEILDKIKPCGEREDRSSFSALKFISVTGESYGMKDFTKTKEFGGGGGARGGATLTKYTESGQCYFCSLVFNVIKKEIDSPEDLSIKNFKESAKYCDTGSLTIDMIIENVSNDEGWTISMIRTANLLYKDYKGKFKSPVYFHRDSNFMNKIYSYHKECLKINPVQGSFDKNKWNPGDIWMTTLGKNVNDLPELTYATWPDLNKQIFDLATSNKLLGVSLKKVEGKAEREEYNNPKITKSTYRYESYRLAAAGSKGSFFNSIDMYMKISGIEIQFRATNTTSSWQGEVQGGGAAGGKIGGGNVNEYLKKWRADEKGLFKESEKEVFAFTKTSGFMEEFFRLYKKYYEGADKTKDLKEFEAAAKAKDADSPGSFYFSKYMNLKFLDLFMTSGKQNNIASDFIYYAKSQTKESSYFIKIS
jgi:hypothetical protein